MTHHQKIIEYYNETEQDYKSIWHHKLEGPPALHFGYYDDKATKHRDALYRVNEILADLADIRPGDKVLDAGCGLGHAAIWLARERGAVATGISIVKEQTEKAAAYAAASGVEGVSFVHADYLKTPFDNESFDVVWGIESVCHAPDKSLFYNEAFRLLRPGGRLVLADSFRGARLLPARDEKLLHKAFSGWQIPDIDTPAEHTSHAKNAGFETVRIIDVSEHMWTSYKNIRRHARNFHWFGYILLWLGIINRVRLNNVKSSGRQAEALKRKAFRYMHLLATKPMA